MEQSPSWEADSHSASQEIPHLLWNPWFITLFTTARHWFLSWASLIQSTLSHAISLKSIQELSSRLHQDPPSGPFPSDFPRSMEVIASPLSYFVAPSGGRPVPLLPPDHKAIYILPAEQTRINPWLRESSRFHWEELYVTFVILSVK